MELFKRMTTIPTLIKLTESTHRFFRQLATAQAATGAYIVGYRYQAGAAPLRFSAESKISQVCFTQPIEIEFDPGETLSPFSRGVWPSEINLGFHAGGPPPAKNPDLTATQLLMGSLYEHAFITYFENNRPNIEAAHGRVSNWPNVLNFARIVRNAFAHGGTVDIRDSSSAIWGGVTYSASDNGRQILYHDISSGDLTLLMLEMDKLF